MEITRSTDPNGLTLAITGRLDAYWADHLTSAVDDAIRGGAHALALDLAGVAYLSSAGIRTLLVAHREIGRVGGTLRIVRPSDAVTSMLEMAGLLDLLVLRPAEPPPVAAHGRALAIGGGALEAWTLDPAAILECRLIGDPDRLETGFAAEQCRTEAFPKGTFGIGLGAFGRDFEDCRGRFGELLAAGGAAAYLPTDGTNVADFLISGGGAAPEVRLLYGLRCSGEMAHHARFEAAPEQVLPLSALAAAALELAGADAVGLIVVAEAAGLVGASLRRSPALGEAPDLDFPEIRRWVSFTTDRAFGASQALVVGVAARSAASPRASAFLRPISANGAVGHFHAAAFSHRPLPGGPLELEPTVGGLFESEVLRGLLHLLHDDRETTGLGETALRRGALWTAPIELVTAGGAS